MSRTSRRRRRCRSSLLISLDGSGPTILVSLQNALSGLVGRHRSVIDLTADRSLELPGDRHGVSANASETQPAKLLAVFVVDTNETELTIPFGN